MAESAGATLAALEGDARLLLSEARHPVDWLPKNGGRIAVRIHKAGCIYLKSAATMAKTAGHADEDEIIKAIETLVQEEAGLGPAPVCWTTVEKKPGRGRPIYRIRLPGLALFALLEDGQGALGPWKQKHESVQVLVQPHDDGMFVWSRRAWGLVRTDLDLTAFGL